ncbi:MAG: thioesterase family protein [Polyangiales bacterium]
MSEQVKATVVLAPVEDTIQVRFSDTDAMGHISSGSYAAFAEVGRETFFKNIPDERSEIPWFVLARLAMDYPREGRYGQVFTLHTRAIGIGDKSLTLEQIVHADGKVVCRVEVVMVGFDPATRKSAPVPKHWRLP